ncbi:hypothetical protein [Rhizobium sp. BG6]|nr:hypothetical protein [Rhizobium sp. BG6]
MGVHAVKAKSISDLESQIITARGRDRPSVIVIDTDAVPGPGEGGGGFWWDVAVPEVGTSEKLNAARTEYVRNRDFQKLVN